MKDDWLTPRCILDPLKPFDLDPCAPVKRLWEIADTHYTRDDDGLNKPWQGFVWCHPTSKSRGWLNKLRNHSDGGIALVPANINNKMFLAEVWPHATALLFISGKTLFYHERGGTNSRTPMVLIAYGDEAAKRITKSGIPGTLITTWTIIEPPVQHGKVWIESENYESR